MPSSRSGAICCSERRRLPLVTWNSGVRLRPSVDPGAAALARGKFRDHRLPVAKRETGTQFLPARALPGQFQRTVPHFGLQAVHRLVLVQIAIESLGHRCRDRK